MSLSDPAIEPVQFRQRAHVIEAMQWTGDNEEAVREFVGIASYADADYEFEGTPDCPGFLVIPSRSVFAAKTHEKINERPAEGRLYVAAKKTWVSIEINEWVAQDSEGFFYPIEDAVFVDTYDRADGPGPITVNTPVLQVDISCQIPGPQLTTHETSLLVGLLNAAEEVAGVLWSHRDPEGYQAHLDEHPESGMHTPPPQAKVSITPPDGGLTQIVPSSGWRHGSTRVDNIVGLRETLVQPEATIIPLRPGTPLDSTPDPQRFGRGLTLLRKQRDLSRMQLKVLAGLGNFSIVGEIEDGHLYPREEVLDKLAGAFDLSRQELIDTCLRLAHG